MKEHPPEDTSEGEVQKTEGPAAETKEREQRERELSSVFVAIDEFLMWMDECWRDERVGSMAPGGMHICTFEIPDWQEEFKRKVEAITEREDVFDYGLSSHMASTIERIMDLLGRVAYPEELPNSTRHIPDLFFFSLVERNLGKIAEAVRRGTWRDCGATFQALDLFLSRELEVHRKDLEKLDETRSQILEILDSSLDSIEKWLKLDEKRHWNPSRRYLEDCIPGIEAILKHCGEAEQEQAAYILCELLEAQEGDVHLRALEVLKKIVSFDFDSYRLGHETDYDSGVLAAMNPSPETMVILDTFCERYHLASEELLRAWSMAGPSRRRERISIDNMARIASIEGQFPGSSAALYKEFGIRNFARYPEELLVTQREEKNENKPYGIVLYPHADSVGAFYNFSKPIKELFDGLRERGYALRIMEAGSVIDATKKLLSLDKRYGASEKIRFAVIGGHGTPSTIAFGEPHRTGFELDFGALEGGGAKKIGRIFEKDPTLILVSCSTGQPAGIGESISEHLRATVIAPKVDCTLESIRLRASTEKNLSFDVKYGSVNEEGRVREVFSGTVFRNGKEEKF